MRLRHFSFLLAPITCLSISCEISVISHDEQAAAKSASKFASQAFVEGDYDAARTLHSPQLKETITGGKLASEIAKMHPKGRPSEVMATEFEPSRGQRAMNIYLRGTGGEEQFFYRLLMVGDQGAGYKVGGLWRGKCSYPPSARKPL